MEENADVCELGADLLDSSWNQLAEARGGATSLQLLRSEGVVEAGFAPPDSARPDRGLRCNDLETRRVVKPELGVVAREAGDNGLYSSQTRERGDAAIAALEGLNNGVEGGRVRA